MIALFRDAPAHWRPVRLRRTVLACQNGVWGEEARGGPADVICVRVADFDRLGLRLQLDHPTYRFVPDAYLRQRILRPGDLLLEKSGGGEQQPVGAVVLYEGEAPAVCSNFIARMPVAAGFDPRYLCYLHAALYRLGVNRRSIRQTTGIQNLDSSAYLAEMVRMPDLGEQRQIADFLDRETALLNRLVENKERILDRVAEKRHAAITRTVAGGLDNRAPRRFSGVSWLGDVPAHWRVTKLKFVRSGALLYGANEAAAGDDRDQPRYVRITDLDDHGALRPDTFQSLPEPLARPYLLEEGDILLARSGATVGKAFRYRREWGRACFAGYLVRLRPDRRKVLPDYLHYYTQSHAFRHEVRLSTVQATIANVSAERYGRFSIPLPPISEQEAIVGHLDRFTSRIRALESALERQVEKLHEYRSSLIVQMVTRGWSATQPPRLPEAAGAPIKAAPP